MVCLISTFKTGTPLLLGLPLVSTTIARAGSVQPFRALSADKIISDASGNNDAKHAAAERRTKVVLS